MSVDVRFEHCAGGLLNGSSADPVSQKPDRVERQENDCETIHKVTMRRTAPVYFSPLRQRDSRRLARPWVNFAVNQLAAIAHDTSVVLQAQGDRVCGVILVLFNSTYLV